MKKILFIVMLPCLLATSAFAKAGYDNFKIIIKDPQHNRYSGKVAYKYNCIVEHDQKEHILQAQRDGDHWRGVTSHNLICTKGKFFSKHFIRGINIKIYSKNNNSYVQAHAKLPFSDLWGARQFANDWVECQMNMHNKAHLSCKIRK